ncbi:response regulator [Pedobacter changchengzhani]|uniref:Response regulator n=1 Tax=Pedobacter changchengzhani TaxID=2529274 RepID=A0A4R5MIL5_9SPHI|nr:response regulator [Pedobacter changchengzhani]TDG34869.1 response regulator [Pedobacter changchengzhani]
MKKILVVDDDIEVLETIQLILEIGGFEVSALSDGEEVFKRIEDFKPDLLLLDISLGHIDGRVLCEQLKATQSTSQIPILLISGLYEAKDFTTLNYGQDDFLSKPFQMDVLLKKIFKILSLEEENPSVNLN